MEMLHEPRGRISFSAGPTSIDLPRGPASGWTMPLVLALCAVFAAATGAAMLTSGGGGAAAADEAVEAPAVPIPAPGSEGNGLTSAARGEEGLLQGGGYSLELPRGWRYEPGAPGAALNAVSADGMATTTLWIEERADLDFAGFERRSLRNLGTMGEGARVVESSEGATPETSSSLLRAELPGPEGVAATYLVALRASGPFRYRLATTVQGGAAASTRADAESMGERLQPWLID